MNGFASLHKKKIFCSIVLFIAFSGFAADIFDLREELQIISCSYNGLDDNITTGTTDHFIFDPAPILLLRRIQRKSSVVVSSSHLPPCGFRAPPFQS